MRVVVPRWFPRRFTDDVLVPRLWARLEAVEAYIQEVRVLDGADRSAGSRPPHHRPVLGGVAGFAGRRHAAPQKDRACFCMIFV